MPSPPNAKERWFAKHKQYLVETYGCASCRAGKLPVGFLKHWDDPVPYKPRSYAFYNGEGINVTKFLHRKHSTVELLTDLLGTCVLLCRRCNVRSQRENHGP